VQIGDPFEEKKLMECCLELRDRGLLVALQDLGAAGLTSSAPEMAAAGGVGMRLDLDRVPLREDGMQPWEIVISESQERMLAIVQPDDLEAVVEASERWETGVASIGEVTDGDRIEVRARGEVVADLPLAALVDGCPAYDLEPTEPKSWSYPNSAVLAARVADVGAPGGVEDAGSVLLALLASPSIASKEWAFEQYDWIVQSRTVRRPQSAEAAVLAVAGGPRGIAITIDGNGRRVACDPYTGSVEAVLEGVQNLACVGAAPLGLTDCLNFGNPEGGEVAWQLDRSVQGLADACARLGIPVVGGNASLYNEYEGSPIYPTPIVGIVGELPDVERTAKAGLRTGDAIAVIRGQRPSLAGSELAKLRGELGLGLPPVDVAAAVEVCDLVRRAVREGVLSTARDVSDGGLACALAEAAVSCGVGLRVELRGLLEGRSPWELLFGEGPGTFVVAGAPEELATLAEETPELTIVGEAVGGRIEIAAGDQAIGLTVDAAADAWRSLAGRMEPA